jgi:hypothetical protein
MILNEEAEDFQYKKNRKNSFFFGSIAAMQVIKFRFHYTIFFFTMFTTHIPQIFSGYQRYRRKN